MMTYPNLLIQFKAALRSVIDDYEDTVEDNPSPHRAINILALRDAIDHFPENSDALLSTNIADILKAFKTGLKIKIFDVWIPTGHSTLKGALKAVLNDPQYSNEAFLRAQIRDLKCALHQIRDVKSAVSSMDNHAVLTLKKTLAAAQAKVQSLAGKKKELAVANQQLQKKNEHLESEKKQMVPRAVYRALNRQNGELYDRIQQLTHENKQLKETIDSSNLGGMSVPEAIQAGSPLGKWRL